MDARKDSSMMNSIAVLTMVFLPATFIAVSPFLSFYPVLFPAAKDGFYRQL
jgi:hypothetical protein